MKTVTIDDIEYFSAVMAFDENSKDPFYKYHVFTKESKNKFGTLFVQLPNFISLKTDETIDTKGISLIQLSIDTKIKGFLKFLIPLEHYDAFFEWAKKQNLQEGPARRGENKKLDAIFESLNQ